MKLRTKFRITLVVIALVLVAVPYAVGRMAERRYHQLLAAFNAQYGNAASTERYDRGVFSSDVETRVDVERLLARLAPGVPASELGPLTSCVIRTRSTVRHGLFAYPRIAPHQPSGPIVAASKNVTTITLPPELTREPVILTTYTVMKLDRTVEMQFVVPPGDRIVAGEILLTSSAEINGFVRFDKQLERVLATLAVPHVTLISEEARVELRGLRGFFNTLQDRGAMPLASTSLDIAAMAITLKDEPGVFLTNLSFASSVERSNALLNVTYTMTVDAMQVAGDTYGPLSIRTAVRNVHAGALDRLQTLAKNAQQNIASGANPTAAMGLMMASMPDVLTQFLQVRPCIDFQDWSVATPHGTFTLHGTVAASSAAPINAFSFLDASSLLRLISADLTVALPHAFVDNLVLPQAGQVPLDISALLVKTSTHYTSHIIFTNGLLTVNGTSVPLGGLD